MKYALTSALLASTEAGLTPQNVGQFMEGVLVGALDTENLHDYVECTVVNGEKVMGDLEDAVHNFKKEDVQGVT
jgi:hypothetical protein